MKKNYTFEILPDVLRLTLYGPLEIDDIHRLKLSLENALRQQHVSLVVDLALLACIDSSTIGFFTWLHESGASSDGVVTFANVNPAVAHGFEILGFPQRAENFSYPEIEVDSGMYGKLQRMEECECRSSKDSVKAVRDAADAWFKKIEIPATVDEDLHIAVDEALANAVIHGARGVSDPRVKMLLQQYEHAIVVEVYNNGTPFDGTYEPNDDVCRENGRGIMLMRALTDCLQFIPLYRSDSFSGTSVRLVKRLDD